MTNALRRALAPLLLLATGAATAAESGVDAARFLREPGAWHGGVHVTGVQAGDATVALDLRRIEVFARDVQLIADDGHGNVRRLSRPQTRYYTGKVTGAAGAVFLAVEPDGRARGIVDREGAASAFEGNASRALRLVPVDTNAPRADGGFRCGADDLEQAREVAGSAQASAPAKGFGGTQQPYRARAAIETDYEFFQKFDTEAEAVAYVGDIIGYASTKYVAEVDTRLEVSFLRLWTTASDPWAETTSDCSLYELGKYWNTNMTATKRTFVHMLSGRRTGGGIAWVGVLCSGPFTASVPMGCTMGSGNQNAGGDYGFTGSLGGNFNAGNPQVIWDSVSPAHEIGHNFNSPHTHCYAGIGGNADVIDRCYGGQAPTVGCYSGAPELPGPAGQGSGTIMSYCHLRPPGFSNISMTFGTNHPYGVAPERVPARMSAYVANRAQMYPECLGDDTIFADGFD